MEFSNGDRSLHGINAQAGLEYMLRHCFYLKYISGYTKNYRVGIEGYDNQSQFYVPFLICFEDGTKWALFTTTSMRTDRIKGQQWDAENVKRIMPDIRNAFLVYPDGLDEDIEKGFKKQNEKYQNKEEFSALDAILSQTQILGEIEKYALKILNSGQLSDRLGNNYEILVASILSSQDNLTKWKTENRTLVGTHFDVFMKIVTCFNLFKDEITKIYATADKKIIGRLPSGGNPKTDVLVYISYCNKPDRVLGISCKRSSDKSVSVHQYNATAFSNVLNPNDSNLKHLLEGFQTAGSQQAFGEDNCVALETALRPYQEKLALWVLGGWGGDGTPQQCASYIITYSDRSENTSIHEIREYYYQLLTAGVTGNFGTVFSWTYPSKRRGMDIQLKCRIL